MTTTPGWDAASVLFLGRGFPLTSSKEFMTSNFALDPLLDGLLKGNFRSDTPDLLGICMDDICPAGQHASVTNNVWLILEQSPWKFRRLLGAFDANDSSVSNIRVGQKHTF